MNAQTLFQVNTLMVRAGISEHRAQRLYLAGKRAEAAALEIFAHAARSRARFFMSQLG